MKTHTLTGADLNRAVAMALGHEVILKTIGDFCDPADAEVSAMPCWAIVVEGYLNRMPNYATDITAAWPIIVEHDIKFEKSNFPEHGPEFAYIGEATGFLPKNSYSYGATRIEAAMRCFVASKFGDEVELP